MNTNTMESAVSYANPKYRAVAVTIGAVLSVAFWVVMFIIL